MTPETRKYGLNIWLRHPARKIRMTGATEADVQQFVDVLKEGDRAVLYGPTKAGNFVVIPAGNVAYVEAVGMAKEESR